MKFRLLASFLSVLFFFFSCGGVKKAMIPSYLFKTGSPLSYKIVLNGKFQIGMGLFKYGERFTIKSDLFITAAETNSNGYKINLELTNYEISGADATMESLIYDAINFFNSGRFSYYMTYTGKAINAEGGSPDSLLNSYAQIILPDLSDIIPPVVNESSNNYKSQFPAKFEDRELVITHAGSRVVKESGNNLLTLLNTKKFTAFSKEDFEMSEQSRMGSASIECEDMIHIFPGELIGKKGKFQVDFSIATGDGFLKSSFDIRGNGNFEINKH